VLLLLGESSRWAVEAGQLRPDLLLVRVLASVATPICLGCLAAYLLHRPAGFRVAWRIAGRTWSAPLAAGLLALTLVVEATPTAVVALAMTFLVVACSIRPDHPLRGLLGWRGLRYVGTISYGMYLLHMLALNTARRLLPDAGALPRFAVAALIAVVLASISFRWFERPVMALKDRLTGRVVRQPAPAPSV